MVIAVHLNCPVGQVKKFVETRDHGGMPAVQEASMTDTMWWNELCALAVQEDQANADPAWQAFISAHRVTQEFPPE